MRTIGIIGGMSWESSAEYYRIMNEEVRSQRGGTHSARCLMWSFDFHAIEALQEAGDWDGAAAQMVDAARRLEAGGAELVVIATNTMHRLAPQIEAAVELPLLHIADPTAAAIAASGATTVGLLGTRYTMEQDFYRGRLEDRHGLEVLVPDEPDRTMVHDVIYDELVLGIVEQGSRARYVDAVGRLVERGAQGVILGCTEIELLIGPDDVPVPVYPTTELHARAAVEWALA
ncbi:MAG: aspartate/glutamate racemase family protein [Actinomycetia bacterium]|nr:aspartate/glutamate racemase family protein [Actinomycetes bacterium]MCP4085057.1 aspartate/glutamate racemase family protein [Actinomycetes bacterium]